MVKKFQDLSMSPNKVVSLPNEHHVVVIPGLGGGNPLFDRVINSWKRFGFIPHSYNMTWKDSEGFASKLKDLIKTIDNLKTKENKVSLVGTSAGGSMALNAYYERQTAIHRVINVCGRLKAGENVFPTLDQASKKSPSFRESVIRCEKGERRLSKIARKKIMTIRPFMDEIVPVSTTTVPSAHNIQIYSVEHMLSITLAMTFYVNHIVEFLKAE